MSTIVTVASIVLAVLALCRLRWAYFAFFVISGFLISTIILKGLDQGTFSFADFYARRIRRIFPALVVVLAACLAAGWFLLLPNEYQRVLNAASDW